MYLRRLQDGRIVLEREDSVFRVPVGSMAELLRERVDDVRALLDSALEPAEDGPSLPPIDGRTEVWASGVTLSSPTATARSWGSACATTSVPARS